MFKLLRVAAPLVALALATPAMAAIDWSQVDQAMGKKGAMQAANVYKFTMPRTDLKVTLDGVEIKPTLALGSYLAFQKMGSEGMVMGDLVLLH
jgi:hypothetical protein